MSALSVNPTFPIFTDIDGQPLENGYVYIGTANLDPQGNPINVYWDAALTQLAVQPIRTRGGYPVNSGTPARLYVNSDYSIRVMNQNGSTIYSAPAATERINSALISNIDASQVTYTPAGTGAVATTVQSKLRETVSVTDFGAIGNGTTDDTTSIRNAIATGKSVFFPEPNSFYLISDEIGPKFPGQILYSDCRVRGMIRNTTNSNRLAIFGDPSRADGAAPQSGMRGLYFQGNTTTVGGIALPTVRTLGNPSWTDASKDCIIQDCGVDYVGSGYALEVYSWENEIINFTAYIGNLRGAIYADSANQNNTAGLYVTGCTEHSLQIGGDTTGRRNRANVFTGLTVQQSGGTEGCVVIADADNTVINGVYSESNNSKSAPRVVYVKNTAVATQINGLSHLGGGSVVYRNEGSGSIVTGVVSSNITGAIITNAENGTLVATGIDWMSGFTPSGAKFSDLSTNKTGFYMDGSGLSDATISSFAPKLRFIDQSAGVNKSRLSYDQGVMQLEYDSGNDGTYAQLLWSFNSATPEFIINGIARANTDNTRNLGTSSRRWSTIYAGTGTINTSDEREKQDISTLEAAELRVASALKGLIKKFKFKDSVQVKGEAARIHVGVIAQEVVAAFQADGLDPMRYGIVCYDEWEDEEGVLAGNRYGVRYEELLAFIIAAL